LYQFQVVGWSHGVGTQLPGEIKTQGLTWLRRGQQSRL